MSDWISIIERYREEQNLPSWGIIPPLHYERIARRCGPAELADVRARLRSLERELVELPAWDGDARDEIWRARRLFEAVLQFHGEGEQ